MYDLLVIGGGINGAGIARDAAGRGLSVALAEKDDLASHTSSASTKLVHGGLRYLEHYEFRLVRESLREREVLLRIAPHLVRPLRFVLPHHDGLRPRWMLRLGLFLYDHLGGNRSLPGSEAVDLSAPPHAAVLKDRFARGFAYSDCWVDDARLVVPNAIDARERGARIMTEGSSQTMSSPTSSITRGSTLACRMLSSSSRRDSRTWTDCVRPPSPRSIHRRLKRCRCSSMASLHVSTSRAVRTSGRTT